MIAVIDSGYTQGKYTHINRCNGLDKDFTDTGLDDRIGHGSHIANIIGSRIDSNKDYCIVIIKFINSLNDKNTMSQSILAFQYAKSINAKVVNYSAGGTLPTDYEKNAVLALLQGGTKVFVAAGNNNVNLDKNCYYFPACYKLKGLRIVGNMNFDGTKANTSNYGKVITNWEKGQHVVEDSPNGFVALSGTSQATAIATAKAVNRMLK